MPAKKWQVQGGSEEAGGSARALSARAFDRRMTAGMRPEARLLILCARTDVDKAVAALISDLLEAEIDWEYLLNKAQQNAVMPLVSRNLLAGFKHRVPGAVAGRLQDFLLTHTQRNLLLTAELLKLLKLLESNGVRALPFKGPALASCAYGDLALRQYGDLDILVDKSQTARVTELLTAAGYRLAVSPSWWERLPTPFSRKKDLGFVRGDGMVKIELHWRLSGAHFDLPINSQSLWDRLESVPLAGKTVRQMSAIDLLLYLCVHGSRHGWERLGWICDVAELLRSRPDLDWPRLMAQAAILGCERVLLLGLYLAHNLLDAKIPPGVLQKMRADPSIEPLAAHTCEWLFRGAGDDLKLADWRRYHLDSKERLSDRVSLQMHYGHRYLKVALNPNERDRAWWRLPKALSFVYYGVRPVRLFGVFISSLRRKASRVKKGAPGVGE